MLQNETPLFPCWYLMKRDDYIDISQIISVSFNNV